MITENTQIGWIGVGAMGYPMSRHVLDAGYSVHACDKLPDRLQALRDAGAAIPATPADVARNTEVVFSTIYDDNALIEIVSGSDGLLTPQADLRLRLFVDMSTVSPSASAKIADMLSARNITYLRAPVSGTVTLAQSAQLGAYVSGPRSSFEEILPLLKVMTAKQTWVGEAEEARVVKMVINMIVYLNTATLGEGLLLGTRAGLDRSVMIDAINDSVVGCLHYKGKAEKLKQRDFSPVGPISLVNKDMELVLSVARDIGAPLPMASLVKQYLVTMTHAGQSNQDLAALADILARMSMPSSSS